MSAECWKGLSNARVEHPRWWFGELWPSVPPLDRGKAQTSSGPPNRFGDGRAELSWRWAQYFRNYPGLEICFGCHRAVWLIANDAPIMRSKGCVHLRVESDRQSCSGTGAPFRGRTKRGGARFPGEPIGCSCSLVIPLSTTRLPGWMPLLRVPASYGHPANFTWPFSAFLFATYMVILR